MNFKKLLKRTGYTMGILLLLLLISGSVLFTFTPDFGGKVTMQDKLRFEQSGHYKDGIFVNQIETNMNFSFGNMVDVLKDFVTGNPNRSPAGPQPVVKIDSVDIAANTGAITRLTWFGHSAFLLEIEGKKILLDPMLTDSPSPLGFMGPTRYTKELPIEIEKLPYIDAVILSHDHYDHLDYKTIQKIKDKTGAFFMPLGVGIHFREWGIEPGKIFELNWWDEITLDSLTLACTPSRHFSGRGLTDRSTTLWSSWVIIGKGKRIYFSGDSGYGPHFKEIGNKYGPFDVAMMECGQYNERWKAIHMMPEETVDAFMDVKGKLLMPIHWGAFTLALHSWTDPIERVTNRAAELGAAITTPKIGEPIILEDSSYPSSRWWETIIAAK